MIRASIKGENGKPDIMIIGLTSANLDRMKDDKPVFLRAESVNLTGPSVCIFYGDSPAEVLRSMKDFGLDLPDAENIHIEGPKEKP